MKHLFLWKGRSNRTEYLIIQATTFLLDALVGPLFPEPDAVSLLAGLFILLLLVLIYVVIRWVICMAICRRFHDMGLSGWWFFAFLALPVCFLLSEKWIGHFATEVLLYVSPFLLVVWPGTKGYNKYGPQQEIRDMFSSQNEAA